MLQALLDVTLQAELEGSHSQAGAWERDIILISIKNYVYIVPYVEDESSIFLKTIIPSRKMNKRYNKAASDD
ncbi:MAG: hypothetical protein U1D70_17685 [Methylobacter sp.]|nr:hypothetical protein [Methylobacter sp.]MDP2429513.1 hypothetical protein [Methylobacter sp.]MDP3056030.1 hypothetical protein [Methylobacter sp.]MDP3361875.1 hypothetical protein [Methylobacter sp.]MDZ4220841.1 hypothetical protein [Methylobacter sp.]